MGSIRSAGVEIDIALLLYTQAISSTEGFTFVLSGLKAFLEQNTILNLVADRHFRA